MNLCRAVSGCITRQSAQVTPVSKTRHGRVQFTGTRLFAILHQPIRMQNQRSRACGTIAREIRPVRRATLVAGPGWSRECAQAASEGREATAGDSSEGETGDDGEVLRCGFSACEWRWASRAHWMREGYGGRCARRTEGKAGHNARKRSAPESKKDALRQRKMGERCGGGLWTDWR